VPAGTGLKMYVRTGSTSSPDATWSAWKAVGQDGRVTSTSRYAQYRVELTRGRAGTTPVLNGVGITSDGKQLKEPTEIGG
jgi:hypothetical protein